MTRLKLEQLKKPVSHSLKESEERSARILDAFAASIQNALGSGQEIALSGFGNITLTTKDGKPAGSGAANLTGDMATRLSESNAQRVDTMMVSLLEVIKGEILSGKTVELDEVGAFEVRRVRPTIEKQAKGHRLIKPAYTTVNFVSKPIQSGGDEVQAVFAPADPFRKKIDQYKEETILLVVPERDYFTKTLEYYFENAGWDIETITTAAEASKRLEGSKAYLVILDAGLPDNQKFCQSLKSTLSTANVPLINLWPSENAWKFLKEVSFVGDENLTQPFEFRQLLDAADNEIIRAAEEELIFLQQINIHLPTDEQSIERVIDQVHRLVEASGITEEGQVALSAAFREAVVNAAQHGNKYRKEKKIEVLYLLDNEKITAVVKDQGQGFDHEKYVKSGSSRDAISAARERHAQGRMGGLGILLMLRCCDRLEYNQQGNQITLTKYLKGPPA